jgi:menaquinone-specific isochorismate synthase
MVGWGSAAVIETGGPDRFGHVEAAWRGFVERLEIHDEVGVPGSGPVAFVSFAFDDDPGRSVLVVPRVVVGRRAGRSWITEIDARPGEVRPRRRGGTLAMPAAGSTRLRTAVSPAPRVAVQPPTELRWAEGGMPAARWRSVVAEAVRRMRAGELDKVVLARDLVAHSATPFDPRHLLASLAVANPHCWTYAVDNLVGATPELLLRRRGGYVDSRVLAGTSWPGGPIDLLGSAKIRQEHEVAVESLVSTLAPVCTWVRSTGPAPLRLPSLTHLSTDVRAELADQTRGSLLSLAEAVHPTAAVGGTPRPVALSLITELETAGGMDRGRYAGPVGWLDAQGDGELGIALRCAQLRGRAARLFAGCGLVAHSDPDIELAETEAKFRAVREALTSGPEAR